MTESDQISQLVHRARNLAGADHRAVVGITGPPGSGKTTLVEHLLARLRVEPPSWASSPGWVAHVPMDGYHLADVQLERLGLLDRKGAPATFDARGYVATLRRLKAERRDPVYVPGFERDLEQPIAAALHVPPEARLVLTEGNYLLLDDGPWADVREVVDEVWYVELDARTRLDRLVRRHVQYGKEPETARAWAHGTDEANAALVEVSRQRATLVVSFG